MNRYAVPLIIGLLLLPLGCGDATGPVLQPSEICSTHGPSAIATFEDANLEAAVRIALADGAPSGPLQIEDVLTCGLLSGLTRLEARTAGIVSLVGIQNFAPGGLTDGLMFLELGENSISDISALSGLTSLTSLELSTNFINDIGALSGLTSLLDLFLGENSITDVSALSGLSSLRSLAINSNSITDISALSGLTGMEGFLILDDNPITDISALSGLTSLEQLSIGTNLPPTPGPLSDISALSGFTSLQDLWIQGNSITDISALSGLTNLRMIDLNRNANLTNIQPLLDNGGLGVGDFINLSFTNVSCADVAALEAKRINVASNC